MVSQGSRRTLTYNVWKNVIFILKSKITLIEDVDFTNKPTLWKIHIKLIQKSQITVNNFYLVDHFQRPKILLFFICNMMHFTFHCSLFVICQTAMLFRIITLSIKDVRHFPYIISIATLLRKLNGFLKKLIHTMVEAVHTINTPK